MIGKYVKSTAFRPEPRLYKQEQERRVAELFAKGYEAVTGIRFEGNGPGPDPPDWLFFYQGLKIGVEMFELEQFYEARALFDYLTNDIYAELGQCGASERYEGLTIIFGILADAQIAAKTKTSWLEQKKRSRKTFAQETVNLLRTHLPSRDSVPEGDRGVVFPVDPSLYPAMSALVTEVVVHRCRTNTSLRTDGKAMPLVIISSGFTCNGSEIEESIEENMVSKMQERPGWTEHVDHSVLVAHDLPRGEVYQAFGMDWIQWLGKVAPKVKPLQVFDELWLVTVQNITGKAEQICGRGLNQRTLRFTSPQ